MITIVTFAVAGALGLLGGTVAGTIVRRREEHRRRRDWERDHPGMSWNDWRAS